jgi:hypothetical protein
MTSEGHVLCIPGYGPVVLRMLCFVRLNEIRQQRKLLTEHSAVFAV